MGHPLPRAQGEPARTRHPGHHPACSWKLISVSPGPDGTRCFQKKALGEEGLSSRPQGGSAKPKCVLCSSQGTAAESRARQKPRPFHWRLNESSGSGRREQSLRSVDLSHSHPKSQGERAPRDRGHRPVNTEPQRGPPSWPGSWSWRNPGQSSASEWSSRQDQLRPPSSPHPAPQLLMRSCSPSHTRIHRAARAHCVLRGLGSTSVALPGGSCVSELHLLGVFGALPRGNRGNQSRALHPPEAAHTTHLGPRHTCAPVQVTQPCTSTSSRVPVSHSVRNKPLGSSGSDSRSQCRDRTFNPWLGSEDPTCHAAKLKKREGAGGREGGSAGRRHVYTCS